MDDTRKDIFKKIHERCFQLGSCNYKETGCSDCPINVTLVKAETLLDKQEQGLLIELPCKVGDTVYFILREEIIPVLVDGFSINENGLFICGTNEEHFGYSRLTLSVENTYFTRSEAEEALAKMKGEK